MAHVNVTPYAVDAAAGDLASVGSTINAANANAKAGTTGVEAPGGDSVSAFVVALFAAHAQAYQTAGAQAATYHDQFVQALRASELKFRQLAENAARLAEATAPATLPPARKIIGRSGNDYFLLDVSEILAFQAEGELVWIITAGKRLLATKSLRKLETHLKNMPFQRVHRNAIVNVNHVRKLSAVSSQRLVLTLSNSQQLMVSKREARALRNMLGW